RASPGLDRAASQAAKAAARRRTPHCLAPGFEGAQQHDDAAARSAKNGFAAAVFTPPISG
ncbi:MAG: hypothetical protein WA690_09960, partial [Candidatus Acidiferrales bacterium]